MAEKTVKNDGFLKQNFNFDYSSDKTDLKSHEESGIEYFSQTKEDY